MMKGFAFKLLPPKDIVGVLNMIGGIHPAVTGENIDRPLPENAFAFFSALSEFAYDMDAQQVKAAMPGVIAHPEIYDEAMDVLTVFKLSRQLAMINLVDDFNFKDFWEPGSKRFRAILSGFINFCRYKEAKVIVITEMKEDVQALDGQRLELVDQMHKVDGELAAAQERHNAELHDMWTAENEAAEAKTTVEKLTKTRHAADRVVESAEKNLHSAKEQCTQSEQRIEQLREQVSSLQGQIAESPEGLEKEIKELQDGVRQQKAWLEEKAGERRARKERDQILGRLVSHVENYREELNRVQQSATASKNAHNRTEAARDELANLRQMLEARRQEELDFEQSIKSVTADTERTKQAHAERMEQLEVRRQEALAQHQELAAKRSEEHKQLQVLQSQRLELEAEVAQARRAHEAEMSELHSQRKAVLETAESYNQSLEALLQLHSSGGLEAAAKGPLASPDVLAQQRRRVLCSPSPARAAAEQKLLMSPPPLPGSSRV